MTYDGTRDPALALAREHTKNENLVKHMLAVEAAMRFYARKYGEDEDKWGIVGLLHDFDYEKFPNQEHHPTQGHPTEGSKILREKGYPEEIIKAILSHADYTGIPRESVMEKALFACDELTGFIVACALVRPNKTLAEVEVNSVRKKMKDKAFARQVSREDIIKGAEELGLPLEEHIGNVLEAMKGIAGDLGL